MAALVPSVTPVSRQPTGSSSSPVSRLHWSAAPALLQGPRHCRLLLQDCYHCPLMSACCSVRTDPLPVCSPGSSSGSVARCCCSVVYMRPAMIPATVHCPHCRHSHRRPPAERGLIKILLDSASLWGCSLYQGIVTNVELLTTVPVFCCTTSPQ